MPHFVIHCSASMLDTIGADELMSVVHDTADATGLFKKGDIKVRIQPFTLYTVGNAKQDFLHVFAWIMQGRTTEQKADLSKKMIIALKPLLPEIPVLSINVDEFEKAVYCNKTMV